MSTVHVISEVTQWGHSDFQTSSAPWVGLGVVAPYRNFETFRTITWLFLCKFWNILASSFPSFCDYISDMNTLTFYTCKAELSQLWRKFGPILQSFGSVTTDSENMDDHLRQICNFTGINIQWSTSHDTPNMVHIRSLLIQLTYMSVCVSVFLFCLYASISNISKSIL